MADQLLVGTTGKILLVKNPQSLTKEVTQVESISALSRQAEAVILFSHGDERYDVPPGYTFPSNVHHIRYAYETLSRDTSRLTAILEELGLSVRTRHLDATLPFILTGSVISLPVGKSLDIYSPDDDLAVRRVETPNKTDWEL